MQTQTETQLLSLLDVEKEADLAAITAINSERVQREQAADKELRAIYDNLRRSLHLDLDNTEYTYDKFATVPYKRADGKRTTPVVTVGGYRFVLDEEYQYNLFLIGTCPNCQKEVVSEPIFNMESFGKLRKEFAANYAHTLECSSDKRAEVFQVSRDEYDLLQTLYKVLNRNYEDTF